MANQRGNRDKTSKSLSAVTRHKTRRGLQENINCDKRCDRIKSLLLDSKYDDVTFRFPSIHSNDNSGLCDGDSEFEIRGSKAFFCAQSEVLANMLYGSMMEASSNVVTITDISIEAFQFFKEYCYFGDPTLTQTNVVEILYLCDKYLVNDLHSICIFYISQYCTSNAQQFLSLVKRLFYRRLDRAVTNVLNSSRFYSKKYKEIMQTTDIPPLLMKKMIIETNFGKEIKCAIEQQEEMWDLLKNYCMANVAGIRNGNNDGQQSDVIMSCHNGNTDSSKQKQKQKTDVSTKADDIDINIDIDDCDSKTDENDVESIPLEWTELMVNLQFVDYFDFTKMDEDFFNENILDLNIVPQQIMNQVLNQFMQKNKDLSDLPLYKHIENHTFTNEYIDQLIENRRNGITPSNRKRLSFQEYVNNFLYNTPLLS